MGNGFLAWGFVRWDTGCCQGIFQREDSSVPVHREVLQTLPTASGSGNRSSVGSVWRHWSPNTTASHQRSAPTLQRHQGEYPKDCWQSGSVTPLGRDWAGCSVFFPPDSGQGGWFSEQIHWDQEWVDHSGNFVFSTTPSWLSRELSVKLWLEMRPPGKNVSSSFSRSSGTMGQRFIRKKLRSI